MFFNFPLEHGNGRYGAINKPWKRNSPKMLDASPNDPTMMIRRGLEISEDKSVFMNAML